MWKLLSNTKSKTHLLFRYKMLLLIVVSWPCNFKSLLFIANIRYYCKEWRYFSRCLLNVLQWNVNVCLDVFFINIKFCWNFISLLMSEVECWWKSSQKKSIVIVIMFLILLLISCLWIIHNWRILMFYSLRSSGIHTRTTCYIVKVN